MVTLALETVFPSLEPGGKLQSSRGHAIYLGWNSIIPQTADPPPNVPCISEPPRQKGGSQFCSDWNGRLPWGLGHWLAYFRQHIQSSPPVLSLSPSLIPNMVANLPTKFVYYAHLDVPATHDCRVSPYCIVWNCSADLASTGVSFNQCAAAKGPRCTYVPVAPKILQELHDNTGKYLSPLTCYTRPFMFWSCTSVSSHFALHLR